jgi:hypothetical protein
MLLSLKMMALSNICTASTLWLFPDEAIRINNQTGQIVSLHNIVCGPIEPTVPQSESSAVSDNGASEAFNMYEANDIWMHGKDPRFNTCRKMIWLRRVNKILDYKFTYSTDSDGTELLDVFHLQLCISNIFLSQSRYMQPNKKLINTDIALVCSHYRDWRNTGNDGDG